MEAEPSIKVSILNATGLEDGKTELNVYCVVKCTAPKTKSKQTQIAKGENVEWNEGIDFPLGMHF